MDTSENNRKMEDALKDNYTSPVSLDATFKKNLDKLVENTIQTQKLEQKHRELPQRKEKKGFFSMLFTSAKWQMSFLASFFGIVLMGGVAFAAVPELREKVFPTQTTLTINSIPEGAEVFVKESTETTFESLGTTPLSEKIDAGTYEVKLELESYEEYLTQVEAEAGKSVNLEVTLKKSQPILDRIKEWITYTDLEHGFELTYPLEWNKKDLDLELLDPNDFTPFEIIDTNTKIEVYPNLEYLDFAEDVGALTINEKTYPGLTTIENWNYIVVEKLLSEEATNSVILAFYASEEEHFEIYDFIRESVTVYEKDEEDSSLEDWNTVEKAQYGFTLKYPQDWVKIEKRAGEQYAEFNFQATLDEKPLQIIYSELYLEEFDTYLFDTELQIGTTIVKKYMCGTCEGKYLYEFPNRVFAIYELSDDLSVNDTFEKIVSTIEITSTLDEHTTLDYELSISLTAPDDWEYEQIDTDEVFLNVSHGRASFESEAIKIFNWNEVKNLWEGYVDSLELENVETRSSIVRIAGRDYTRFEIWSPLDDTYILETVMYLAENPGTTLSNLNPQVVIGNETFVIMYTGEYTVNDVSTISGEIENYFGIADAIVSSIDEIGIND